MVRPKTVLKQSLHIVIDNHSNVFAGHLLATTAMVLTAGVAAAEVSVGANARMGLAYDGTDTTLSHRLNVNVNASTETTSGLTFGAWTRLRIDGGAGGASGQGFSGARIYVASNGFEFAMGNIWGAINSMPGYYHSEIGFTDFGSGDVANLIGYSAIDGNSSTGSGPQGIEVMYTSGAFSGHLSYTDDDLRGAAGSDRTAAHLAYTMGDWTVAVGGQSSAVAAEDFTVVTVGGTMGDYGFGFSAMDADAGRQVTLNGSATFGATTVSAYVSDSTKAGATDMAIGAGFSHDLGGAALKGGVEKGMTGDTYADLGVSFSF